ncbi:Selenocysteine lyase/Cysteine desulfurase [Bartonella apihabitans]|uniref:aminotransferase class V-fold PLP-dependent enzyme n=1 Tax=Bartonella apihabitans TaxID=2750929 RepID=UPI00098EC9E0|nr:aminotransferase class V-fold PLP-dependent enzyme [Bartonella apihabitans]AQT45389.1 Selenocysteine lyase/Cysteine desulfurase [Bartonella apihabitans]
MQNTYNVSGIRKLFPAAKSVVYLDSGLQSPMPRPVKVALDRYNKEAYENAGPKSIWLNRTEQARNKLARFINASPDEIAFTKNTSEALNIAANALPLKRGDNVLLIHGDHPNNAYAFLNLRRKGIDVRVIPMTEIINSESFLSEIDENTRAISMSHVTFHAGHKFDIEDIGRLCREKNIYFIVDIMQSIGVVPIDVQKIGATFLCSGTHKGLFVPQGLGFLWWDKKRQELEPTYLAAASVEHPSEDFIANSNNMAPAKTARRFEIGNYNLAAIQALDAAIDLINKIGVNNIESYYYMLGDRLIERLDCLGISLVGPRSRQHRAPHIYVLQLQPKEWLEYLSSQQIRCSPERDGIRISFGLFNNELDLDKLLEAISNQMKR